MTFSRPEEQPVINVFITTLPDGRVFFMVKKERSLIGVQNRKNISKLASD